MSESSDFVVYAYGVVYSSVCTSLPDSEADDRLNALYPTGTDTPWEVAAEPFRTGESNPCPCNDKPVTHRHILFVVPSTDVLLRQVEERFAVAEVAP